MKKKTITLSTILALISTFCAFLTMLITVSNKVVSMKERVEEETYAEEYQIVEVDHGDTGFEKDGEYFVELPDGRIVMIELDDNTVV